MNWLKKVSGIAFLSALSLTASQFAYAQQKPPVKLGAILPITGFVATAGAFYRTAMEIAVEDVNKNGGINGSSLALSIEDDKLEPAQSVLMYRKLVSENVVAVLGPISSGSWENVVPLAMRVRLPLVNFTTFKQEQANNEWTVRLHPHEGTMIPEAMKEFVRLHPSVKRVVIAADVRESSSEAAMREFTKVARDNGLEVLDTIEFQTRMTDFSQIAIKVRGHKPDAVLTAGLIVTVLPLIKELRNQGINIPIFGSAMLWPGGFPNAIGTAGQKVYTTGFSTNQTIADNPRHNEFIRRFNERLKDNSSVPQPPNAANAVLAYEGILLLADLMIKKKVDGATEPAKAREAIKAGFGELQNAKGIYSIQIDKSRNGYLPARLLEVDLNKKEWVPAVR